MSVDPDSRGVEEGLTVHLTDVDPPLAGSGKEARDAFGATGVSERPREIVARSEGVERQDGAGAEDTARDLARRPITAGGDDERTTVRCSAARELGRVPRPLGHHDVAGDPDGLECSADRMCDAPSAATTCRGIHDDETLQRGHSGALGECLADRVLLLRRQGVHGAAPAHRLYEDPCVGA